MARGSAPTVLPGRSATRRPRTIAFVVDQLDQIEGGYETEIREGVLRECGAQRVRLLIVAGRGLDHQSPIDRVHNRVYDLLSPDSVDGVIVLSATLSRSGGVPAIAHFIGTLAPLPVCSIGVAVPGVPSITVDNATGVKAIVEHLVGHHGVHRLAFIAGPPSNPEANAREAALQFAIEAAGLDR